MASMSTEADEIVQTSSDFNPSQEPQFKKTTRELRLFAPTEEHEALDLPEETPLISLPNVPCDLDTYTLTHLYAEGGTARVYKAFESHSKQPVAIKLLRRRFQDDLVMKTIFLRHGRALSKLNLPHFAKILNCGESPWGPWWAIEWVEGETLKDMISKGVHWHSQRLLSLMSQLCEVITALHSQDIVHGDLKPDNVIYSKSSRTGEERLTLIDLALPINTPVDLGIDLDKEQLNEVNLKKIQSQNKSFAFGNPVYLAPECIKGRPADFKSDLYGLGLLFFELSTGTLPYNTKIPEVIFDILHKEAPSASRRQSPWPYPSSLDALISNLLSKRPADRIATADDLTEQINKMLLFLNKQEEYSQTEEFSFSRLSQIRKNSTDRGLENGSLPSISIPSDDTVSMTDHALRDSQAGLKKHLGSARKTEQNQHSIKRQSSATKLRLKDLVWFLLGLIIAYLCLKYTQLL
jgi:eukaryotic-like serine/threonine-protein kinase